LRYFGDVPIWGHLEDAVANLQDVARTLKLIESAERKAEAVGAILSDRKCATVDAIVPLYLGWLRLADAVLTPPADAASPNPNSPTTTDPLQALLSMTEVPGVPSAERPNWSKSMQQLIALHQGFERDDPTEVLPSDQLLQLSYQLLRSASSARQLLGAPPRKLSRRRVMVLSVASVLLVGGIVALVAPRKAPPPTGWLGEYFRNQDLAGKPTTRRDSALAFFWDEGAPMPGFPTDHFSARWTGCLRVPKDRKATFSLASDDGSRLFVDGQMLINNWKTTPMTWTQGTISLTPGLHVIRVEYQELVGVASVMLKLGWDGNTPEAIDPTTVLLPNKPVEALDPDPTGSSSPCDKVG
jgi:hypothetical protein